MSMTVKRWELGSIADDQLTFAVSVATMDGQYLFCRHSERTTWECPGGHIEAGEAPLEAARRELYEETGAAEADVEPVCIYSVESPERPLSFGLLCRAQVRRLGDIPPMSEIVEVRPFAVLPDNWTYPDIVPRILEYVQRKN